nr:TonB-dependent receptor [Novosphingobium jiangmenense]
MAQNVTAATLSGTVVDDAGNPVPGATVTVESAGTGFTRTTTAASNGTFSVVGLQVGTYNVTVAANGFTTTRSENVAVTLGGNNYDFTVSNEAPTTGEIVVRGAPVRRVDFSGTATGQVFSVQEVAENLPVPRSIEAIQLLTPQATSGDTAFGGISLAGSSVAENIFYINGMNVTNFRTFVGGTTVPFEFYDQVQVKTGGYQAEFGRNTGGAVIALTRSGSNTFHGGFNVYYEPNALRNDRPNTYAARNDQDYLERVEGNIWASGPIIKDRLFFFGFFNPRYSTSGDTARTQGIIAATGAPDGNFTDTQRVTQKSNTPFYGGKLDLNLFDGHRVEATYFNDSDTNKVYVRNLSSGALSQVNESRGGENYIFKYTGSFTDWLTISGLYGRSKFNQTDAGPQDADPYVVDRRSGVAKLLSGNPNALVASGRDDRENFRVDVDLNFSLLGEHKLRFGWDYEKLFAASISEYSGGIAYIFERAGASGARNGLIAPNTDYARVQTYAAGGNFKSNNTAYYVQDDWDLTDRINLSLGLRNDKFVNKTSLGTNFVSIKNQWAPRLGINFDPTGEKKARLSAFYGRYYLPVAANTNIRLGGAELFLRDFYTLPTGAGGVYSGSLTAPTLGTKVDGVVFSDGTVSPPATLVSQNLKPQYMDEFIVGGEYRFDNKMRIGINVIHRKLGTVLEDVDLDGDGQAYDSIIGAYCATQTLAYCNATTEPTVNGGGYILMNPGRDAVFQVTDAAGNLQPITIPASFIGIPKAKRDYWAVELNWERPFDGTWGLNASYVWSRSWGNYEGGVKSDTGQDDTGITSDFDEPGYVDGATGYLPNHRAHTFKVFGSYKPTPRWLLSFNALLQSPRKFGCIGTYPKNDGRGSDSTAASWYCNAQIAAGVLDGTLNEPIGRGRAFQSDWNKRLDLGVAYTIPMESLAGGITLRADVFNVFNFKSKLDFQELGDRNDASIREWFYGLPTSYQTPRYVRFGVSANF